ncbi:MAG: hypothetical protein RR887_06330 [Niameybacter sp.]
MLLNHKCAGEELYDSDFFKRQTQAEAYKTYFEHVAFLWEEAATRLKHIGFKYYTTFEKRKSIFKSL